MDPLTMASVASGSMPTPKDYFNLGSTLYTNYQSRKFSREMYDRTRADNIEFWNMQNEYNLPVNQMARFKGAGLNPNLIYGQGNSGPAGSIPTPDVQPVNFREPRLEGGRPDIMGNLLGQADLRIKGAQADNLEVQNDLYRQEVLLRRNQALREGFKLDFDTDMRETSADYKREQLRGLTNSIDLSMNRDARDAARTSQTIQESMERILSMQENRKTPAVERDRMRSQISLLEKEGILRDVEIKLRADGINPSDPMWARYVGKFLEDWMSPNQDPASKGVIWRFIFGKTGPLTPLQSLPGEMKSFPGAKY